jgi:glucose-1-phosphate thymidylyltransferase
MYLGDNLIASGISSLVEDFQKRHCNSQILLARVPNPSSFGVAELESGKVVRLSEKPPVPRSDLALVGVYMFDPTIFEAVHAIRPSARNELEITDAIQWLVDHGRSVHPHLVTGWWKDTGKVEDMLEGNRMMLGGIETDVQGSVDPASAIEGRVIVGKGSVVERSRLRGPIIVGEGARICDSYVGPFTSIAEGVELSHCEIEHSIVLERSRIENVPGRIESSLIGRDVVVCASDQRPRTHRLMLGDSSRVELS